ncbi:metalloregulator ArsR/SmtB family transcription factor [Amycolatopsis sp. NBC_01307]|uniref:ArsR/SmtB family transcription factor n=1 Tax=Amycolatopsis sp. NBC_01307 TaxID=2903561 RepID=UPI002E13F4C0|nr:metalloregulator ArsR/SmtB family transcription factor [Amycolatopsis sp. NBC_01307]
MDAPSCHRHKPTGRIDRPSEHPSPVARRGHPGLQRVQALAHPTRVQLMNLLLGSRFAVCAYDLQVAMGMPQSTISHHLKLLVGSGLVHRQQRGIWAYFSINTEAMRALGLVINLDDAAPQPLSPAALRDPAVEHQDEAL